LTGAGKNAVHTESADKAISQDVHYSTHNIEGEFQSVCIKIIQCLNYAEEQMQLHQ
jgi:hypothetical protein